MFLGCCSHHGGIKDAGAGKPCGLCGFTTRLSQAPVFTPSPSSPLPLTIIYVCKDLKCFSPLCSVKSGMPCTGRETKVCSEQAEKHCSLVVLCLFAGLRGAGGGGEASVSLLALPLLLLLLDTCRSSCETSFPCFVLTQTCPHHLLALAALPRASVPQTVHH